MEKRRAGGLRFRNDLPVFIEEDHHEVGTIIYGMFLQHLLNVFTVLVKFSFSIFAVAVH